MKAAIVAHPTSPSPLERLLLEPLGAALVGRVHQPSRAVAARRRLRFLENCHARRWCFALNGLPGGLQVPEDRNEAILQLGALQFLTTSRT